MLLDTPLCDFGWQAAPFTLADPDGNNFELSHDQTMMHVLEESR